MSETKMKKIVAAVLASFVTAPAFAGGLVEAPVEPRIVSQAPLVILPASYNWSGPFAGVTLGVGVASTSGDLDGAGVGGGFHLGFNVDMGNWVAGGVVSGAPGALVRLGTGNRQLGTVAMVQFRAGPKLGADGSTFAFGSLGAVHARSHGVGGTQTGNGIVAGLGASHAFQQSMFVTGEVIHARSGSTANVTAATLGVSFRF